MMMMFQDVSTSHPRLDKCHKELDQLVHNLLLLGVLLTEAQHLVRRE